MKRLNFYPYYGEYLRSRTKTTTIRLTNSAVYRKGDEVMLSLGWTEDNTVDLHIVKIREIYRRYIKDLTEIDLEGESPDCKSSEAAKLVLSCIYKAVLSDEDEVWVVKFDYME